MFAIDGVKLLSQASKERSGTHDELMRQVALFRKNQPSPSSAIEPMKTRIDSSIGRQRYSQRIGTVEPVFANLRHNKRLNRFTLRGRQKVLNQ